MSQSKYSVDLNLDQAGGIARDYLIDLLDDLNVPFTDPTLIKSINQLIAYMSVPGTWEDGKYDR